MKWNITSGKFLSCTKAEMLKRITFKWFYNFYFSFLFVLGFCTWYFVTIFLFLIANNAQFTMYAVRAYSFADVYSVGELVFFFLFSKLQSPKITYYEIRNHIFSSWFPIYCKYDCIYDCIYIANVVLFLI